MPNTSDDFITVVTAASLAGRSYWTIRRWIASGALTRYTSAGRVVVNKSQLLDLVRPLPIEGPITRKSQDIEDAE
jgi:hypothetical protein